MHKSDEGMLRPQPGSELFTRHDFRRVFEQQPQNLHRLPVEPDSVSVLAKLPGARIKLEGSKALGQGRLRSICHDPPIRAKSNTPKCARQRTACLVLVHMITGIWNTLVSFRFQVARFTATNLPDFSRIRDDLF